MISIQDFVIAKLSLAKAPLKIINCFPFKLSFCNKPTQNSRQVEHWRTNDSSGTKMFSSQQLQTLMRGGWTGSPYFSTASGKGRALICKVWLPIKQNSEWVLQTTFEIWHLSAWLARKTRMKHFCVCTCKVRYSFSLPLLGKFCCWISTAAKLNWVSSGDNQHTLCLSANR